MQSVEASAKTREDAIQSALKELGAEMYEVDKIEILDEGSRGLLGFGARPVRVRVSIDREPEKPQRGRDRGPRDNDNARQDDSRGNRGGRGRGGRNASRDGESAAKSEERPERAPREAGRDDKPADKPERSERPRRRRGGRDENRTDARAPQAPRAERDNNGSREQTPRPPREEKEMPRDDAAFAPVSDEVGNEAATLLREMIVFMGIEATVDFARPDDGTARLNVSSVDGAILIGRKGATLSALQYLINRMVSHGDDNENLERLIVDVEGYVDRRRESLEDLARDMAAKAKEAKRNMRLKPMSPQERRIIHVTLQDDEDIRTFSTGESLYRSVVISPKGAPVGGASRPNRGGRGRGGRGRGGRGRQDASRAPRESSEAGQD